MKKQQRKSWITFGIIKCVKEKNIYDTYPS